MTTGQELGSEHRGIDGGDDITITAARSEIRQTVRNRVHQDSSFQEVQAHVLKALGRQCSTLDIADILELRVILNVDAPRDASLDEQITIVFDAVLAMIAEWEQF